MKLLRIILAAALLTTGSVCSTGWVEHTRDLRVSGPISPAAVEQLSHLAAESDGVVRYRQWDGRIVLRESAAEAILTRLSEWAQRHGLALPDDPTDDQAAIQTAEAVVAENGSPRGDSGPPPAFGVENTEQLGFHPHLRPRIVQVASWRDPAPTDPSAPRGPPVV
jgi:hypothetical protein